MISQPLCGITESQSRFPSPSFSLSLIGLCFCRERAVQPLSGCWHTSQHGVAGWGPYFSALVCLAARMTCCFRCTLDCIHPRHPPTHQQSSEMQLRAPTTSAVLFLGCTVLMFPCAGPKALPMTLRSPRYLLCLTQEPWVFSEAIHTPSGTQKTQGSLWLHYVMPPFLPHCWSYFKSLWTSCK